ncbi:MAG: hypothetical protein KAG64_08700 [Bacteroidales bacterium]|nr:hypothetical protein [Bacteroidales bacterium]
MKTFLTFAILLSLTIGAQAQFGRVHNAVTRNAKRHAEKKAVDYGTKQANKGIDKGLNEAEKGVNKLTDWEEEEFGDEMEYLDTTLVEASSIPWGRLTFVTGEDLIFYDKPFSFDKKHKEPYYWLWDKESNGSVEISDVNQGYAIGVGAGNYLTPKVKDPKVDYLPKNFTFEFEYIMPVAPVSKPIKIQWYAMGQQDDQGYEPIYINRNRINYKDSTNSYPIILDNTQNFEDWYRVSIRYKADTMRIYMNERLLIVFPEKKSFNPTGVSLDFFAYTPIFFKSFIIASNPKSIKEQLMNGQYTSYKIDYLRSIGRLSGVSMAEMLRVAKVLIEKPDMIVDVDVYFSHEQKKTKVKENDVHGQNKAKLIKETLVSMGVDEKQVNMNYKGYIIPSDFNPKNKLSEAVIFTTK